MGYDSSNIYRIWNPRTGTVFRTRDVTFDESAIYQPGQVPTAIQEQVLETPQLLDMPEQRESQDNESDSEEEDTITVLPRRPIQESVPEPQDAPANKESETLTRGNEYPTPEPTPERTDTQAPTQDAAQDSNTAPRANEVSGDVGQSNILPQGTRRVRKPTRKEAYFTALEDIDGLSGYHSAFTAALAQRGIPHRDTLPLEPRNWKEMLSHLFAS